MSVLRVLDRLLDRALDALVALLTWLDRHAPLRNRDDQNYWL